MALLRRRRRSGHDPWRDADRALLPIPPTGGLLTGEFTDPEGRPLRDVEVVLTEAGDLRRTTVTAASDVFGFLVVAVPPGSYALRAALGGHRGIDRTVQVPRGGHAALGALVLPPDTDSARPPVGRWVIDDAHSRVGFVARHIALSKVYGRFTSFRGAIEIADPFEDSTIDVTIDTASIDTAHDARDTHLRSGDFLDVEQHPRLTFSSTRVALGGGSRWEVDGALTIRGQTDDVRLHVDFLGTQQWNGTRAAATATARLHREHFTLNWQQMVARGVPVVGSTIDLTLDVQAVLDL